MNWESVFHNPCLRWAGAFPISKSGSILSIFPQPEESDHNQKDRQEVCLNNRRKLNMNGIISCTQDKNPDDRCDPGGHTLLISKKAAHPKGGDHPRPSFS